jgi:hypothetical protein
MFVEFLAELFAGRGNCPRLTNGQTCLAADETERTARKLAQLHIILLKERYNTWFMPVAACTWPFYRNMTTSQPATLSHNNESSPNRSKQSLVLLDQQSPVAVPLVDVLPS